MESIHDILTAIRTNKQTYIGSMNGSTFETLFALELENSGFRKLPKNKIGKDDLSKLKSMMLRDNMEGVGIADRYKNPIPMVLHDGWYIEQPFGSQSFPDFIIAEAGSVLAVEMKKVNKSGNPMWNGGLPRVNGLYIFMRLQPGDITFFMGNTVISDERFNSLKCFYKDVKERAREHEQMLNDILGYDSRNFILSPRAAYDQRSPEANYFTHKEREQAENSTLEQVLELTFI